ncbi:hypothetical protein HMPREF9999_00352 [Alloprevotella sp. oral taxon 473 str. F0040]|nr:hypothetical protein HMPREF9999_00352 [Alloprevotella sp. oral taxon 473 str. F0040]
MSFLSCRRNPCTTLWRLRQRDARKHQEKRTLPATLNKNSVEQLP